MSNFCKTCFHWEKAYRSGRDYGQCKNFEVFNKLALEEGGEDLDEDEKTIFTEETFGCIHWASSDKVVTKLPKP